MRRKLRDKFNVIVKGKEVPQEEYEFVIGKCVELLLNKVVKESLEK